MQRRDLSELINTEESSWPMVKGWIEESKHQLDLLPPSDPDRANALLATQVTTRSPMGSIVYESGGILIDHGWLRVLGSGHPKLPRSLPSWNKAVGNDLESGQPPYLYVADDVLGGFFALDGGVLGDAGKVFYFAPDTLNWENTGNRYSDFLSWCLAGDFEQFYSGFRWLEWQTDIASIDGSQGISVYPYLWAEGPDINKRQRGIVPIAELYKLSTDFANQLG